MEGEVSMNNCAKRRRSSLSASPNPAEQQTHATSLVDQADALSATITTTVKRSSKFRLLSRHHHDGRCEARAGRVFGSKYLHLGTVSTRDEADHACDNGAIECRGISDIGAIECRGIRWLRSGANSFSSQLPRTLNSQVISSTSELGVDQNEESEFSFNNNPLRTRLDWGLPWKQECIERKMQGDPSNRSAQTALGILLRSSMFRELVEKNMKDETEENERKKFKLQSDEDEKNLSGIEL